MKAQKWVLVKHFEGVPKDSDLELQEEDLPEVKDGDVLFEAVSLSVDPYMRPFSGSLPLNSVMIGEQLSRVLESRHTDFKEGELYLTRFGWRTHTVANMNKTDRHNIRHAPDTGSLPPSALLGTLGMPGVTACIALLDLGEPKEGETVLVTGAAGAVGNVVGQIAKIKGCRVIGSAGTDEKVAWLKDIGFDHAFNYKTSNLTEVLNEFAPEGVDIYFDNVGGDFSCTVVKSHMKKRGRVLLVGSISEYNDTERQQSSLSLRSIRRNNLHVKAFAYFDQSPQKVQMAENDLKQWTLKGKLKYQEHVTNGFSNMRSAFYGLFKGENIGKSVVNI